MERQQKSNEFQQKAWFLEEKKSFWQKTKLIMVKSL